MAQAKAKTRRRKIKRNLPKGQVHIQSTFNNTIISVTDETGNVVSWASSGSAGFKGSRKSTPYAAQIATEKALEKAKDFGLKQVSVIVQGIGSGRESAIRALQNTGVAVTSIRDITGVPHNGCRPRKAKRN
ncbi:MAG: small subunit ribosomal protein [Patescibacteria group bacterium]|jgi:small subunit ribosomal protein S11|nr:small subunit ribosomal protein [Patescibacteria group bacterium]